MTEEELAGVIRETMGRGPYGDPAHHLASAILASPLMERVRGEVTPPATQDGPAVLRVNADKILLVLRENGVTEDAAYIAVQIANALDPITTDAFDPEKVARLYRAISTTSAGLTNEATRMVAIVNASIALGAKEARLAAYAECAGIADDYLHASNAASEIRRRSAAIRAAANPERQG